MIEANKVLEYINLLRIFLNENTGGNSYECY